MMKSKQQVIDAFVNKEYESQCLDGRDTSRLLNFLSYDEAKQLIGEENIKEEYRGDKWGKPKPWTEKSLINQLKGDVEFGFEKALDNRGISASLMYEVVKMWLWILEDELYKMDEYPMYGLPLFKAVAVKYGFDNTIGDDNGSENKYDEQ
jgi:hypothetical protein